MAERGASYLTDTAPGPVLGENVKVGENVTFGAYVVVHDGTTIGDGCVIEDHVVLGKRPRLARSSSAKGDVGDLVLGERVTVCSGAVVFAGANVADEAILGDQSFVRERSQIGAGSVIGRGSVVDNDVIVGARVRVQTSVYLTAFTVVEDDVFVGPGATTTNDNTMNRHEGGRTPNHSCAEPYCGAPVVSGAARCSPPAWRSARRRSWRRAPSSPGMCPRGASRSACRRESCAKLASQICWSTGTRVATHRAFSRPRREWHDARRSPACRYLARRW